MKRIGKIIKNNTKLFIGIIIGVVISGGVVYAATIAASNVTYTSNSQSTVSGALDTLFTRSNTWLNPSNMQSVSYKYWTVGTTGYSANTNVYMGSIPTYATATAPSGSSDKAWIRTTVDSSGKGIYHEACLYLGSTGKLFCIPRNAWNMGLQNEATLCKAMDQALGTTHTSVGASSSSVYCYFGSAGCRANSFGDVYCGDGSSYCLGYGSGYVSCY